MHRGRVVYCLRFFLGRRRLVAVRVILFETCQVVVTRGRVEDDVAVAGCAMSCSGLVDSLRGRDLSVSRMASCSVGHAPRTQVTPLRGLDYILTLIPDDHPGDIPLVFCRSRQVPARDWPPIVYDDINRPALQLDLQPCIPLPKNKRKTHSNEAIAP